MKIELNKQEVLKLIDDSYLTELIVNRIYDSKLDSFGEFDSELLKALEKAAKIIVDEYIKEYYSGDIQSLVREQLKKMTKEEIIEILKGKI